MLDLVLCDIAGHSKDDVETYISPDGIGTIDVTQSQW